MEVKLQVVSLAVVIRVVTHGSSSLTAAHSSSAFGGLLTSTCMLLVLSNKGKGMQSSSQQPLVGRIVT